MTKYFVTYTIAGGLAVEAESAQEANDKAKAYVNTVKGVMQAEVATYPLDELT